MRKNCVFFLGLAVFIFSLFLAFYLRYNHFYEFTVLGLFLVLHSLIPKKILSKQNYFVLYFLGFFGGLIADFLLGLSITKLWYYSYVSYLEYVSIYLLVYPVGGIVMIQSFLVFKEWFIKTKGKIRVNSGNLGRFSLFFFLLTVLTLAFRAKIMYFGFFFFSLLVLTVFFYFNYLSEKTKNKSYVRLVLQNPTQTIAVTLVVAYVQALIHEVPNVFAKQWIYQNFPFNNAMVFGVPVLVFFLGWVALVVIPVSVYYLVKN